MITEAYLIEKKEYIEEVFNDRLGDLNGVKFTRRGEHDTCQDNLCCMFNVNDRIESFNDEQILEMYLIPAIAAVAKEIGSQSVIRYAKFPAESFIPFGDYVVFNGLIPFRVVIYERRVLVEAAVDSG